MIVKKNYSDQVYKKLKKDILTGEYKVGEKLVNRQLQKELDISSTPIRDAINRLYVEGLVSNIDNTGATILELNYKEASEINELLKYIVKAAIELSYKKNSDTCELIKCCKKIIEKQRENINSDEYFSLDYEFHKCFIDFSKNCHLKRLFKKYNALHELLVRSFDYAKYKAKRKENIKAHEEIVKAYEEGNIEFACSLTDAHYEMADEIFSEVFPRKKE